MSHHCSGEHHSPGLGQTLEEVDFDRTSFAYALHGDLERLRNRVAAEGANARDRFGYTALVCVVYDIGMEGPLHLFQCSIMLVGKIKFTACAFSLILVRM